MTKVEEYTAKKVELEASQEAVKREIILSEQSIQQQEGVFQQQFNTTDVEELNKIAEQYEQSIVAKEQELAILEQSM